MKLALMALLLLLLTGCATQETRLLTPEQDREFYGLCVQGCAILDPEGIRQLQRLIQACGGAKS